MELSEAHGSSFAYACAAQVGSKDMLNCYYAHSEHEDGLQVGQSLSTLYHFTILPVAVMLLFGNVALALLNCSGAATGFWTGMTAQCWYTIWPVKSLAGQTATHGASQNLCYLRCGTLLEWKSQMSLYHTQPTGSSATFKSGCRTHV